MLSELDRRYKEHEICVIMAKSHLDNLVGIKPKFIACPHWQCSPKQERMTVCVTSLLMMSAAKKLTPAMMCFNSLFFWDNAGSSEILMMTNGTGNYQGEAPLTNTSDLNQQQLRWLKRKKRQNTTA